MGTAKIVRNWAFLRVFSSFADYVFPKVVERWQNELTYWTKTLGITLEIKTLRSLWKYQIYDELQKTALRIDQICFKRTKNPWGWLLEEFYIRRTKKYSENTISVIRYDHSSPDIHTTSNPNSILSGLSFFPINSRSPFEPNMSGKPLVVCMYTVSGVR